MYILLLYNKYKVLGYYFDLKIEVIYNDVMDMYIVCF